MSDAKTAVREKNWAGNYTYRATRIHRPATVEEARRIVAGAARLRVVGSRHSFSDVGDSGELLALDGLPAEVTVDRAAGTVTVAAGMTYAAVADALRPAGLALHNMASLPHISVGGAIATATHGSGDRSGNLATAVAGLRLVASDGDVVSVARGEADFDGLVVGLGAAGAVTHVTLDVQPAYAVRQRVFEGLPWASLLDGLDAVTALADSVSIFTRWEERGADQVWLKTRVTDGPERVRDALLGGPAATVERHPIMSMDAVNATPQLGVPGPWSDRLPHFRAGFAPSAGAEIQSEFFVARAHAADAIRALLAVGDQLRPALQVSELRTIAADALWLSPQYGQDALGLHFTWHRDQDRVEQALAVVEAALSPFAARPHWGKVFLADAATIRPLYPRVEDFVELLGRVDPRGTFRNAWLERTVLGTG